MEKDRAREGVVSVAPYLASTEWGFPGTEERVLEVTMPPAGRSAAVPCLGNIIVSLRYRAQVRRACHVFVFSSTPRRRRPFRQKIQQTVHGVLTPV